MEWEGRPRFGIQRGRGTEVREFEEMGCVELMV